MAMKFISASAYSFEATYTSSRSVDCKNATLIIAHVSRGNPAIDYNPRLTYAGQPFLHASGAFTDMWNRGQIGVSSSCETTAQIFYLYNTATGTNNLITYQGTQGDASTIQNRFWVFVFASASVGYTIELESLSGSMDTQLNPSITVTASVGSLVFNRTTHDNNTIVTITGNQTYISRSDYGNYTSYWAYAIATSSANINFNWVVNSAQDQTNMIVAFKEVPHTTAVNFIQDELWNY